MSSTDGFIQALLPTQLQNTIVLIITPFITLLIARKLMDPKNSKNVILFGKVLMGISSVVLFFIMFTTFISPHITAIN